MDSYTPDVVEGKYAQFLVRLERCPECRRFMVVRPKDGRNTFPYYWKLNFDSQVEAAGFCIKSNSRSDGKYICLDCEKAGKASFICALCKQKKLSSKMQEQFGDPAEYLCADCYDTVTAREWDKVCDELSDKHRWDYY